MFNVQCPGSAALGSRNFFHLLAEIFTKIQENAAFFSKVAPMLVDCRGINLNYYLNYNEYRTNR